MNIRIPRSGQAARIAKAYLSTLGLTLSHSQALELVARLHGYADNQAMQSDSRFVDPPALRAIASNEFEFLGPRQSNVWMSVENLSVYIKREDEGVVVDIFALGKEDEGTLATTWAMYKEAQDDPDEAESKEGNQNVSEPGTLQEDPFAASEAIKARYLQSGCSRHDAQEALDALRSQCSDIFADETAMWAFLMQETQEDNDADDDKTAGAKPFVSTPVNWATVGNEPDICALRFDKNPERPLILVETWLLESSNRPLPPALRPETLPVFRYLVPEAHGEEVTVFLSALQGAKEVEPGRILLRDGRQLQFLSQEESGEYKVFSPALNRYL